MRYTVGITEIGDGALDFRHTHTNPNLKTMIGYLKEFQQICFA